MNQLVLGWTRNPWNASRSGRRKCGLTLHRTDFSWPSGPGTKIRTHLLESHWIKQKLYCLDLTHFVSILSLLSNTSDDYFMLKRLFLSGSQIIW